MYNIVTHRLGIRPHGRVHEDTRDMWEGRRAAAAPPPDGSRGPQRRGRGPRPGRAALLLLRDNVLALLQTYYFIHAYL